ncbi:hypothetical protein [Aquabacterium sp.]|uniref:hypothetical protein n=1 Tax=Aquabacterium sp. TaxID=1872578 RepID=UPI003BAF8927
MIRYPGTVVRLYEFKRQSADITKEKRKLTVLQAAIRRRQDLRAISQEIHWYVETKKGHPDFSFEARPYLDMLDRSHAHVGLTETIDQVVSHALNAEPKHDMALVQEYLDAVSLFAGKRGGTSSGMLVTVDSKGGVSYVGVEDIRDLRETPHHLLERTRLEGIRERSIQLELERAQKPSRGRGLTLG